MDWQHFQSLEDINRVFGPLIFIFFMFFVGIILMNMFIAVLSEVYMNLQQQNAQVWEIYITEQMVEVFDCDYFAILSDIQQLFRSWKIKQRFQTADAQNFLNSIYKKYFSFLPKPQLLEDEVVQEEEIALTDEDVFELNLEFHQKRNEKDNMDIYKLVQAQSNHFNEEVNKLHQEIRELKDLITQLAKK